jgi:DNA modification methylase
MENKIIQGDALEVLRSMPDELVQCVVTSPPYWGLRDYGIDGQLGLEKKPEEYVEKMVAIFQQVKRVLKKDGTVWLNLGDSYCGSQSNAGAVINPDSLSYKGGQRLGMPTGKSVRAEVKGLKPKDLVGIPWRVTFALQADGWYLRSDIIWSKPNPMPESVTDRPTKAHEYIFLLSKNAKYYYDAEAIKEPASHNTNERVARGGKKRLPTDKISGTRPKTPKAQSVPTGWNTGDGRHDTIKGRYPKNKNNSSFDAAMAVMPDKRNKRSVWSVNPQAFPEAHFATFPEKLIKPCILAGSREKDIVLDPFIGSGTTALVARNLNRKYLGIELNPEYIKISEKRLQQLRLTI